MGGCNDSSCTQRTNKTCKKNKCCKVKYCEDYRLINRLVDCNDNYINCNPKIKRPCVICLPCKEECSSSASSSHFLSSSSESLCCPRPKKYNDCRYIDPNCLNCPIVPNNKCSISSSYFGSFSSSSSSSSCSSSSSSCAPAPKPCYSCPSEKPCCSSCKYCRIQKVFKDKHNYAYPNHRYNNYRLTKSSVSGCKSLSCCEKKKCGDKKTKGKKTPGYTIDDYKHKIQEDKKKHGILVEINKNYYVVDGEKRKTLTLKKGETYKFNIVQETTDGLYHHHLVFTADSKGGHKVRGKHVCPKILPGAPKPCAYGVIKLKVRKDYPDVFYYQDINKPDMGGKIVCE